MNFKLLEDIVKVYGPSSREDLAREFIKNEISGHVDNIDVDPLGNLIAHKKGDGKKIMVSAHMDQIGLMVIDIDEKGFIRFTNVGGISPFTSLHQTVIFENGTKGFIDAEPMDNISKLKLENMFIDIGASSKEEAEKQVSIGDICIYMADYIETDKTVTTAYLDDRVGCFIAIEALKEIKNPKNDLYFVFSVQEEVGLRGAKTAAYTVDPDYGMAIDVTMSGDTPKAKRFAVSMGKGTAIKVKDNSVITSPKVKDKLIELAKAKEIPYQLEVLEFGGTDSGAIHLTKGGVPSGVISIPTRYIHSPIETASKEDISNSAKLLVEFLNANLD